ncbi:triphosphoribosyl-dephospho-CoA synthase [Pseudalkalibacillus salsuginis]|uniref:triphosphoribosyl-dephospho-CoA synthase n=1 Tax=Pseudalkalibacillus salsuginis TaxID=2910972 RepID=UPI001F2E168D|nr:triphosphoribosyl-dephospho-CoA synthase [Pseudalkalibacillus salsuginis]MCF6409608.1 triphosphoribosyl-dephospho-CoA synthase [Pseudalkalibacillus salsuginis]
MTWYADECSKELADLAVKALVDEAELTPKPGLVDQQDNGTHTDMDFNLMIKSAHALYPTFEEIGYVAFRQEPTQQLREKIAVIGRNGEETMMQTTGGVNTHKGAIWAIGLLVASAAIHSSRTDVKQIAITAGKIAGMEDRYAPDIPTNGSVAKRRYGVPGAKGEAQLGFPHVIKIALPALYHARHKGLSERRSRLETLITLYAHVDDTCILHRGGKKALDVTKSAALKVIDNGGVSTSEGWQALKELDQALMEYKVSPGGSADLLAAALFLDSIDQKRTETWKRVNLVEV